MSTIQASPKMASLRKRRFPYTRVACDKCQRRKIKCSGERPCKGCRESDAECVYKRNTRFRSAARRTSVDTHRQSSEEAAENDPGGSASQSVDLTADLPRPRVESTASAQPPMLDNSDYYLRLAEKRLVALSPENAGAPLPAGRTSLVGAEPMRHLIQQRRAGSPGGVLAALDAEYWMKVLAIYEEEVGVQYPFLDVDILRQEIMAAKRNRSRTATGVPRTRKQERIEDMTIVIHAIVSTLADPTAIDIANPAAEEIFAGAVGRTQLNGASKEELIVLILSSIYFFLSDREVLAWRGNGIVMRLLQELTCHGSDNMRAGSSSEMLQEVGEKLYWVAYTLDRRWSFGTGLPFAVQDSDINHHPSFTDDSLSCAYLKHMVSYSNIASEVRRSILDASLSLPATSASTRDFLNFRVVQWKHNLPPKLQFGGVNDKFDPAKDNRGEYKLRLLLHLRANQMRTVIYRKSAVQSEPGSFDPSSLNDMTEIAQDTIRILIGLARETDIYHAQHRTFNHFLETALSSLLLIICSTVADQRVSCLQDVVEAMDLVKQLSAQSPITRRLGDKLQGIQDVVDNIQAQGRDLSHSSTHSVAPRMTSIPRNTQEVPVDPSLSEATAHHDSLVSCEGFDGSQELSLDMMPSQEGMFSSIFSPMHDTSLRRGLGTALPVGFDISQAVEVLEGDFRAVHFPELGEILKDYENFGF
ncbi:hypothetical protein AK830_g4608 [Neonectria ditissima]|uniref:Zn(2)-C6 fungal-type domain-containing protein n=1 Tax=Neonectria ditissima TaxID=78410 RepID=A0A0P7BFQ2_9HYPO|nr:hypothetical protein AK830_g4608 [Neonectria ditissima]